MKQLNNELHSNCNGRNNCIMYVEVTGPGGAPVYCQVSIKDGFTMGYYNFLFVLLLLQVLFQTSSISIQ